MWRLMGAALLTGGGLWMGLQAAGELAAREKALESWRDVMTLMAGELAFRLPDLPCLLEEMSRRAPAPAGEALAAVMRELDRLGEESFSLLWTRALDRTAGALTPEDMEPILRLGNVLGRCGWEEQKQAVERTWQELDRTVLRLREELSRKGRTYGALGFSLGAFGAILLL